MGRVEREPGGFKLGQGEGVCGRSMFQLVMQLPHVSKAAVCSRIHSSAEVGAVGCHRNDWNACQVLLFAAYVALGLKYLLAHASPMNVWRETSRDNMKQRL